VLALVSQDGNYLKNYGPQSWQLFGLAQADSQGHLSGTWSMSVGIDSTWHFVMQDTSRNQFSNQVDVIVGTGTPLPPGPPLPYIPPTGTPTLALTGPFAGTNSNGGLQQIHLTTTSQSTFQFTGSGWGTNTPVGYRVQIWVEGQNLPVPGTPNPSNAGLTLISSNGNVAGSINLNGITWPPGQIITIYATLLGPNGPVAGVQSTPVQYQAV